MNSIDYIAINIIACGCFVLMFVVFLSAKKTSEIWVFLAVLLDCILWSGGSILMRLQMWPGLNFWYNVSLTALFVMELLFYVFVHRFTRRKGWFLLGLFTFCTVCILPGTISGFFLAPPTPTVQSDGSIVFIYNINWNIIVPCVLFAAIIIATVVMLLQVIREQGVHVPGIRVIINGGLVLFAGNLLQVSLPGNTFPFDALAGVIFAILITTAMYKRRMFRMSLVISRSLLIVLMIVICALGGMHLIGPVYDILGQIGLNEDLRMSLSILAYSVLLGLVCWLLYWILEAIFDRGERQRKIVESFSAEVSKALSTEYIMEKLGTIITSEISVGQVYICLLNETEYQAKYCTNPLATLSFSILKDAPQIDYLRTKDNYLILREFQCDAKHLAMWESEKEIFRRLDIDFIASLRDGEEIKGLLLLSARKRGRNLNATELDFLETVISIASIAIKNAILYEKMCQESWIDPLTGVYNYRSFVKQVKEQFYENGKECLTLIYLDVDDFKLYNQLYGIKEGDDALCAIGQCILRCTGESGTVFRTGGKVFAILLPLQDTRRAISLTNEIVNCIRMINLAPERRHYKSLSVSVGICSAPYAASNANELMDNADLAVYNAKQGGKDRIVIFRNADTTLMCRQLAERIDAIINHIERYDSRYHTTMSMISALVAAIDAKDHYTCAHSRNVARYAAMLGLAAGFDEDQVRNIYAAGLLHDIGKISVPERILNKSGKLEIDEYQIMQEHVNSSIEMIRHLPGMEYLIPAVLGHHERWDGCGYPRSIVGEEIPASARCLAIADVFDAITTDRPYRKGLSLDCALSEIEKGAGSQFDPKLASLFVQLVRNHSIVLAKQNAVHMDT